MKAYTILVLRMHTKSTVFAKYSYVVHGEPPQYTKKLVNPRCFLLDLRQNKQSVHERLVLSFTIIFLHAVIFVFTVKFSVSCLLSICSSSAGIYIGRHIQGC